MRTLYDKYTSVGFQLLAFPSNDFAQAPASSECERGYIYHKMNLTAGSFPTFDKVKLSGPGTAEIFTILQRGGGPGKMIDWNYHKFLVAANGTFAGTYDSAADPMTAEPDIRKLLGLPPI